LTGANHRIQSAQQDSIGDYFPLAVGNSWQYHFQWTYYEPWYDEEREVDTGTVEYQVTGVTRKPPLANVWHIEQRRSYLRVRSSSVVYWGGTAYIVDSAFFDLSEDLQGLHALQSPVADGSVLFAFAAAYEGPASFSRYEPKDSTSTIILNLWYRNSPNDAPSLGNYWTYVEGKNTGIVEANYQSAPGYAFYSASYRMLTCNTGARISRNIGRIAFGELLLSRKHLDTAFAFANSGMAPLVVQDVVSNHEWYSGHVDRDTIPSGGAAWCTLRYAPYFDPDNAPELMAQPGTISINSNSVTSPDSIVVSASMVGGGLSFSRHSVPFGTVPYGDRVDSTIVMKAWGGNDIRDIQRLSSSNPWFNFPGLCPGSLGLGGVAADTVRFGPKSTGSQTGFVVYSWRSTYSSDSTLASDTVWMSGVGGLGYSSHQEAAPQQFFLLQNYPNPFNPTTTIDYGIPHKARVRLELYNALGQQVATLVNGEDPGGYRSITLNATGLASGIYFCLLQADEFVQVKKLVVMR